MNIPADLSESKLRPYFHELQKVIILKSREKNLIVKIKINDEISNEWPTTQEPWTKFLLLKKN